jgi:hypothetical protein
MTPRRQRFVQEYLIDCNATAAAKRSGYSAHTAYSQGQRLLRDVEVAAAILRNKTLVADELAITAERVIAELALIAFAPLGHDVVTTADKRAALVDLGKHLNLFVQRHEVGGPGAFSALDSAELERQLLDEYRALGLSEAKARALVDRAQATAQPRAVDMA